MTAAGREEKSFWDKHSGAVVGTVSMLVVFVISVVGWSQAFGGVQADVNSLKDHAQKTDETIQRVDEKLSNIDGWLESIGKTVGAPKEIKPVSIGRRR